MPWSDVANIPTSMDLGRYWGRPCGGPTNGGLDLGFPGSLPKSEQLVQAQI